MFLHLSVSHSVHGDRDPQTETPGQRPPRTVKSGLYASYWNAFLLRYFVGPGSENPCTF